MAYAFSILPWFAYICEHWNPNAINIEIILISFLLIKFSFLMYIRKTYTPKLNKFVNKYCRARERLSNLFIKLIYYYFLIKYRSHDRESGDYAGSVSDIHSVTSRLSQVSVSIWIHFIFTLLQAIKNHIHMFYPLCNNTTTEQKKKQEMWWKNTLE